MSEVEKNEDIVETLADGSTYVFNMDVCNEAADDALGLLWSMEGRKEKFDYTGAVFSLFTSCVQVLTNSGWTTEDLLNEVISHSAADDNICDDCGGEMAITKPEETEETAAPVIKHLH
jgi:hypothetical protein